MTRRASQPDPSPRFDEITLEGKMVPVELIDLPLDEVALDPRNPRIANTVAVSVTEKGQALQRKLEELLWDGFDVQDLYRQILVNGGLIERIIVRHDSSIVEGNCRTVAFRKLREKYPADSRWQRIPSRRLPRDIGDRDVAILLGEMHVAGKNTWTPFEKAGHVYRLHKELAPTFTQDEIARRLKMSKSKVNQLIRAFGVMKENFLPNYPVPSSVRKFSYFEELFKKPPLRAWIDSTPGAENQFVQWVGTDKLSQGVQVRGLAAILENDDAVKALSEEGFDAAQRVLAEDDPTVTSKLFRRMVEMTEALNVAQMDDIQRVRRSKNSKARKIVNELSESLGHFIELCGIARQ